MNVIAGHHGHWEGGEPQTSHLLRRDSNISVLNDQISSHRIDINPTQLEQYGIFMKHVIKFSSQNKNIPVVLLVLYYF